MLNMSDIYHIRYLGRCGYRISEISEASGLTMLMYFAQTGRSLSATNANTGITGRMSRITAQLWKHSGRMQARGRISAFGKIFRIPSGITLTDWTAGTAGSSSI